ncbi:MAG TPA: flagellar biosynthetic protein FliR [Burkholderiales bacterium]|nr:flagellar biosynthetic protein FliR [Burkholderiales bacterium]
MISFTYAQLSAFLAGFIWPLARVAALVTTAPILGNIGVPTRVKVLLALGVSLAAAPLAGALPEVEPWSTEGMGILVQQIVIGAVMGLAMRMVFTMVDVAGELVGLQMGLGFATFFDPLHAAHTPVIAQFLGLLASLVFLSINGHLMMLSVLGESFRVVPIGAALPGGEAWMTMAQWGGKIFVSGLMLALPVVVALLITNVALGILTRAAPQLNLFAVGFPVTILVGWLVLGVSLPALGPVLVQAFDEGLRMMLEPLAAPALR